MAKDNRNIKYVKPGQMFDTIQNFNPKHPVTRGVYSKQVPCFLVDMEWNQMDQLHRPWIHRTYQENIRIALGPDFASSLTRWGRWPLYITVNDMRVDRGVYYSNFTLAGILFVQNIITLTEVDGNKELIEIKHQWFISSHWLFKPLQKIVSKMWYDLDDRLQDEDAFIRSERYRLRKAGYRFTSDSESPDFYTANQLTNNTIYPDLPPEPSIEISKLPLDAMVNCEVGDVEFLVQRKADEVLIWPGACPHEGGQLKAGKVMEDCRIQCPWHGLKFSPARLSAETPSAQIYGFSYTLQGEVITVRKTEQKSEAA